MPASADCWVNDRSGDPLLVITREVDAALTKAMPHLLRAVREVVGERRVAIVFDRGDRDETRLVSVAKRLG
jgi:hypothetical protein